MGGTEMKKKCEMCHNLLHPPPPLDPTLVTSRITIETQEGSRSWKVDDVCAASVEEFILEFMDDVRTGFRHQDEQWKLKKNPHLQRKLEASP